jgi:Family of unknown function (DUF6011)
MTTLTAQPDIFDEPVTNSEPDVVEQPGKFNCAADALRFVLGGKATLTVKSLRSGTRFTYRVRKSDDGRITFVQLLVGSDNETSYKYLGHIFTSGDYRYGRKSKIGEDSPGAKAFNWVYSKLKTNELPSELEIWHEGRCGKCGRKLTVPESIATGFGPECASRMGM